MVFDLVIENGKVVFGGEKAAENINIGITGDRITEISSEKLEGKKVIDASGKIVSPGFIDPHCHSDLAAFFSEEMTSKILQGVTTEVSGNCGIGISPAGEEYNNEFKEYVKDHFVLPENNSELENIKSMKDLKVAINKKGFITNQAYLVGTGCIRVDSVGFSTKKLNEDEMKNMLEVLEKELQEGAYGVSFGLVYQPGNFMDKNEITEILKIAAKHNKIASFHIRNEGENVVESIKEVLECAEKSKCRVNISHLKIMDRRLWGKSDDILKLIIEAREKGLDITYDQYPYTATSTTLMVLIPEKIFDGDVKKFIERINILTEDEKKDIMDIVYKRGGISNILISNSFLSENKFSGKTILEIKEETKMEDIETILYLIRESAGRAKAIYFSIGEEDMYNFMNSGIGVIGSDGSSVPVEKIQKFGIPHPRNFATFPKFIRINRERKMFNIEEMVNKITSKTADIFSIKERGRIEKGYFADITIFDYEKVQDKAGFENPFIKSEGIEYVIINGKIAVNNGIFTGEKAGKCI